MRGAGSGSRPGAPPPSLAGREPLTLTFKCESRCPDSTQESPGATTDPGYRRVVRGGTGRDGLRPPRECTRPGGRRGRVARALDHGLIAAAVALARSVCREHGDLIHGRSARGGAPGLDRYGGRPHGVLHGRLLAAPRVRATLLGRGRRQKGRPVGGRRPGRPLRVGPPRRGCRVRSRGELLPGSRGWSLGGGGDVAVRPPRRQTTAPSHGRSREPDRRRGRRVRRARSGVVPAGGMDQSAVVPRRVRVPRPPLGHGLRRAVRARPLVPLSDPSQGRASGTSRP